MKIQEYLAVLEIDLGFRVWKVVPIVLDRKVDEEYAPGTKVRVYTRLVREGSIGALHTYHGYISS